MASTSERRAWLLELADDLRRWAKSARDQCGMMNDHQLAAKLELLAEECAALELDDPEITNRPDGG